MNTTTPDMRPLAAYLAAPLGVLALVLAFAAPAGGVLGIVGLVLGLLVVIDKRPCPPLLTVLGIVGLVAGGLAFAIWLF